ncbi:hypothetical protein AXA44_45270 [Rhodococcus sp. SC4]|nr:hypothetical protein AXA44_45270 [Rhodococcus sp. SC4]
MRWRVAADRGQEAGRTDLDQWLTDPAGGAYRYETGTFLRWANASKLATTYLGPPRAGAAPVNPIDDDNPLDRPD